MPSVWFPQEQSAIALNIQFSCSEEFLYMNWKLDQLLFHSIWTLLSSSLYTFMNPYLYPSVLPYILFSIYLMGWIHFHLLYRKCRLFRSCLLTASPHFTSDDFEQGPPEAFYFFGLSSKSLSYLKKEVKRSISHIIIINAFIWKTDLILPSVKRLNKGSVKYFHMLW